MEHPVNKDTWMLELLTENQKRLCHVFMFSWFMLKLAMLLVSLQLRLGAFIIFL